MSNSLKSFMNKPINFQQSKKKKILTKQVLQKYGVQLGQQKQQKPKNRLRKFNPRNDESDQDLIHPKSQNQDQIDEQYEKYINDPQIINQKYERFGRVDDQDLKKQQQQKQNKKKRKKLKNNQQIDKFMKNLQEQNKKPSRKSKKQESIFNTNPIDLMKNFHLKKKQRQLTPQKKQQSQEQEQEKIQQIKQQMKNENKPKSNKINNLAQFNSRIIKNNCYQSQKKQTEVSNQMLKQKNQRQQQSDIDSGIDSDSDIDQILMLKKLNAVQNYYNQSQNSQINNKNSKIKLNNDKSSNINQSGTKTKSEIDLIDHTMRLNLSSAKKQSQNIQQIKQNQDKNLILNKFAIKQNAKTQKIKNEKKIDKNKDKSIQIQNNKPNNLEIKNQNKINQIKQTQQNHNIFNNQYVITTGQFQTYEKNKILQLFVKLGANIAKSFNNKVTLLLQGQYVQDIWKRRTQQDVNTTDSSLKAQQRGIRIIKTSDLNNFFFQKTGKTLNQHLKFSSNQFFDRPSNNQNNNQSSYTLRCQNDKMNQKEQYQMEIEIDLQKANNNNFEGQKDFNFSQLWTEKFAPSNLNQVIGQTSQIRMLKQWLTDWQNVILKGNKKDVIVQRGFLPAGSLNSRAALLSGDPGLGKTTTARLLAQQLNFVVTEFNASDIRNKKGVQLLESNSYGLHKSSKNLTKSLIIMDQVDGMSSGDRGGITQLISMIKNTSIPIICICNDRQSQKIRSLAGHCLDIKFNKPDKKFIVKRLQQIVEKQGGKVSQIVLNKIIDNFQNDMRQILTYLQLLFRTKKNKSLQLNDLNGSQNFKKDSGVMLTHSDATRKLLNRCSLNLMKLQQKIQCFFIDSDLVPIMVHQNYLSSMKKSKYSLKQFHQLVKATQGFILADQLDNKIRKDNCWDMMPSFGFMTAVYPSQMVASSLGYPQFPSWLGKFSSERKQKRLIKELKQVIHTASPSTSKSIRFGSAALIYQQINDKLKSEKVSEALDFMQNYNLSPIMMNQVLLPLQYNYKYIKQTLLNQITISTKTKLTKQYNKRHEQLKLRNKTTKNVVELNIEHNKFNELLEQMQEQVNYIQEEQIIHLQNQIKENLKTEKESKIQNLEENKIKKQSGNKNSSKNDIFKFMKDMASRKK